MAGLAVLVLVGACGEEAAAPASTPRSGATESRLTLERADEIARVYGRRHLGHYLKLQPRHLARAGLDVPSHIALDIRTSHIGYCIGVTNAGLDPASPWHRAVVGTKASSPSPADACKNA